MQTINNDEKTVRKPKGQNNSRNSKAREHAQFKRKGDKWGWPTKIMKKKGNQRKMVKKKKIERHKELNWW